MKTLLVAIKTLIANLRKDDLLHFLCCFFICFALGLMIHPVVGLIASVAAGICKELYDFKHPESHTYSRRDVFFGMAGAVIAYIVCVLILFA